MMNVRYEQERAKKMVYFACSQLSALGIFFEFNTEVSEWDIQTSSGWVSVPANNPGLLCDIADREREVYFANKRAEASQHQLVTGE